MDNYKINAAYPFESKYNEIEITSENLIYTELQDTHTGLQCNNQKNEKKIHDKCREISKLIKEINELNSN